MSINLAASPQAYRESAVLTAPPERLVVMLYDGACRFLHQAAVTMGSGDIQTSHDRLRRAEAIIDHLLATLDMSQGEVAQRLESIYIFCQRLIAESRIRQDPEKLEQVNGLLRELREAWDQIGTGVAAPGAPTA
jgi:flagellar protein FliS